VAEIAAEAGAVVIAFVTLPFSFEGGRRRKQAEEALAELRRVCDAVIPLSNDMLLQEGTESTSVLDSFAQADQWIGRGVKSIWAMLSRTGLINVDFTALRQVFQHRGGKTLFGLGVGDGENPAQAALDDLKNCPLLHTPEYARKADRLLVNITGGADLSLTKVNELMTAITRSSAARRTWSWGRDRRGPGRPGRDLRHRHDRPRQPQLHAPRAQAGASGPEADRPTGATTTSAEPGSNTNVTTTVTPIPPVRPPNRCGARGKAQAGGVRLSRGAGRKPGRL